MKKKILILVTLIGFTLILLSENDGNRANAKSLFEPCSNCVDNYIDCQNDADDGYNTCWLSTFNASFCQAQKDAAIQSCRNTYLTCLTLCDDPYPSGGGAGGGGGIEKTPEQQACYDQRDACIAGTYRSDEVQYCLNSGSNAFACCKAEFDDCMGYYDGSE